MNKKTAMQIIGSGLSNTEKMPSYSFNLSAKDCITGSKLVNVKGSVCEGCYALKGNYVRYKHVDKLRPKTLKLKEILWVNAMVYLIQNQGNQKDKNYFRWHDSGDLQNVTHLQKIVEVCKRTPDVKHWLPTREYKFVTDYIKTYGDLPKNLIIRLSSHMNDTKPPKIQNLNTSTVHKNKQALGVECPSYKNKGKCGDCRMCWNSKIDNISYKWH